MSHVEGSPEQFKAFMKMDVDGPIHMLNMLRYKPGGGRDSYAKYSANTRPLLEERGGKIVYDAEPRTSVIGEEDWDAVFIVEYPSKAAFIDMVTSDEYQKGVHLRHEALLDSRLVCMQRA
jgi:uncharacterized protein (DUF1330 family)